jgi:hypothetical protein
MQHKQMAEKLACQAIADVNMFCLVAQPSLLASSNKHRHKPSHCDTVTSLAPCPCPCRRYYQPPGSHERQTRGMTGNQGKPLWLVLTLLLTIVGSSLGVAFGWATGCHYGVYAAFGGKR